VLLTLPVLLAAVTQQHWHAAYSLYSVCHSQCGTAVCYAAVQQTLLGMEM
jgi:hypothetical protein